MTKEHSNTRLSPEIMLQALTSLRNEGCYPTCKPFDDTMVFDRVIELGGVDFAAGEVARTAVENGFDPKRLVEFFIRELVPMVRGWRRMGLPFAAPTEQDRRDIDGSKYRHAKQDARSRVDALKEIGLARCVLAGELNLTKEWSEDEFDYDSAIMPTSDASELVDAAHSVAAFAADVMAAGMGLGETAEMSVRGVTRHLARAAKMGHDSVSYNVGGMLERLRVLVGADPAPSSEPEKPAARRKVAR